MVVSVATTSHRISQQDNLPLDLNAEAHFEARFQVEARLADGEIDRNLHTREIGRTRAQIERHDLAPDGVPGFEKATAVAVAGDLDEQPVAPSRLPEGLGHRATRHCIADCAPPTGGIFQHDSRRFEVPALEEEFAPASDQRRQRGQAFVWERAAAQAEALPATQLFPKAIAQCTSLACGTNCAQSCAIQELEQHVCVERVRVQARQAREHECSGAHIG
mmetsp:Transcript_70028/g.116297  ORF Transcript_70028/g.116297 Transcript_70028/m.116297 type:complete len:219 (-) Transcript_70028:9-665(-)